MNKQKYNLFFKKIAKYFICLFFIFSCFGFSACNNSVEFDINFMVDNEIYATVSTSGNETIKMPTDPTKEGYTFNGWYWDNETWQQPFTANSLLNAPLSSNMAVYAQFTSNESLKGTEINIKNSKLVTNDESYEDEYFYICVKNSQSTFRFGNYVEINSTSTWTLSTDIQGNENIPNKSIELNEGDSPFYYICITDKNGNQGLYKILIHRNYMFTVSFNSIGGSVCDSRKIEEGCYLIDIPTDVTKNGYTFGGWNYDFENNAIIKSFTVNAIWTETIYTITYNLNDGNATNNNTYTIETETFTLENPIKTGYTFTGWTGSNGETPQTSVTILNGTIGNKNYTANWTPIVYTITYNLNGGNATNNNTYTIETETFTLENPIKTGYTFTGWTGSNGETPQTSVTISNGTIENKNYTAIWTANNYTISYNANGGIADQQSQVVTYNQIFALCNATKFGYTFNGWYYNDSKVKNGVWNFVNDITLNANWTPTNYTITYNLNDGNNDAGNPENYNIETETITLKNPTKNYYTFAGWYSESAFTNKVTTIAKGSYGNKTLYAKWTATIYTITYELDDGTNNSENPTTYTVNDSITLKDATKMSYAFAGWYTENTFENKVIKIEKGSYGDKTFYAKWLKYSENLSYSLSSDETYYTVSGIGTCTDTELAIPETYNGKLVKEIGEQAFYSCSNLTSVIIQNSITSIGDDTFRDCSSLKSITIPNSVTSIGSAIFSGCSKLESLTIPFVGNRAGVTLDDTYQYPLGYLFGKDSYTGGVETYQYYYGSSTSETTYTYYCIPSSLKSVTVTGGYIPYGAFYNCSNITSVTIGNSVTSIGNYAFYSCSRLKYNVYDNANYLGNSENPYLLLMKATSTSITSCNINKNTRFIYSSAFFGCSSLRSVTIPNSVTSIGINAFSGCSSLRSVTIPNSVTSIESYAFCDCSSLQYNTYDNAYYLGNSENPYLVLMKATSTSITSCNINENTRFIYDDAFYYCSKLTSITIPNSVTSIGKYAFYVFSYGYSSSLTNVYYTETISDWCNITFSGYYSNPMSYGKHFYILDSNKEYKEVTEIVIPNTVTKIKHNTFCGFNNVTSVTIPNSVTSIGSSAFYGCSSLTSITIPDSVTSIGSSAFYGCSSLTSITIPNSVTSIGNSAFYNCSSLRSVTIGNSVTIIEYSAFYVNGYSSSLTNVYYTGTVSDWCNITFGGDYSNPMRYGKHFYMLNEKGEYYEPTEIVIPDNVTVISSYRFMNWTALQKVTLHDKITSIGSSAFNGCSSLTSVTILDSVTSIGNSAFYNCSSLTSITIPNSVTSIGYRTFYNCSSLTSITIPNSVTSIGDDAFGYCKSLTSVTIGNSVTSIGSHAFEFCSSLTDVYYTGTISDWCNITFSNYNSNPMEDGEHFYMLNEKGEYYEVTKIVIPKSVTEIKDYAFYGFDNLTSVTIGNSVTSIGDEAFYNCSSLTSITIPNSVTSIGKQAFYICRSLKSITIPNSVTSIEEDTFRGCRSLTSVTIGNNVRSIGDEAFYNCSSLTSVTIGNNVRSIGDEVFYNCSSLKSITIPNSVTSIGVGAFSGCSSLKSVTFENTNGWKVSESSSMFFVSSSSLSSTYTAAIFITSTYYYWTRG